MHFSALTPDRRNPGRLSRIACALLLSLPFVARAQMALLPAPREAAPAELLPLAAGVHVVCASCTAEDTFAAAELTRELTKIDVPTTSSASAHIALLRADSAAGREALSRGRLTWSPEMQAEGYAIVPDATGINVVGATSTGVFYGAMTARQLVTGYGSAAKLQTATVRDWPAMKYRGVHDDLSRGPMPTFEFQKKEIRTFAAYKINVYSPYFENTLQYLSDPLAAPPGGTLSPAQARELVVYAAQYHVMIVPEQEAFGHLHYMLNEEFYASLSETPNGHVLAPGQPGSLALTKRMYAELAAEFPAPLLHLGADETVELGKGQTKAAVDAQGLGKVYLDYLQSTVAALKPLNRRFLFWGDIAMKEPALVKALPQDFKSQMIAVAWEYNPHTSFAPWIKPYTDAGIECWVAPGVNNWSRVWPNFNNTLPNIQQFTAQGQASGCTGQLNTIWEDDGEALFNNNWYALLYGAEAAWHKGESSIPQFQGNYGQAFHGDASGKINEAQQELMAAHALLKNNFKTSDASDLLFWIDPWSADGQIYAPKIRSSLHELRLHAERAIILIAEARAQGNLREQDALDAMDLGARRMDLIGLKFQLTDDIAIEYDAAYRLQNSKDRDARTEIARDLADINAVNGKLQDFRNNYSLLRDLYESAWLKSNRPYFLRNNLARYDFTLNTWFARIDKFRSAQRQWDRTQTLPPASDIGIPGPPVAAR
ncbi:glycoside hydrolase family 20 zincin-like fold domain-containing protein [Terriglobus roseus]|uniref:beta-N-acetylhexosaminidase n=1 Tax=Terriglobus roseus TaxID=392734 RepID=A0A1H4TVF6_9BACT|nr:glycoside hydrolase family 20 zincin-like fold domain-containing protein [Terriglobus roseus]SEC60198.1 Glycosyl hydrolase family 20, catalytic domain [Terriglobus roseus]